MPIGMRRDVFADVLRAATALQVAVYELADEHQGDTIAGPALDKCLAELTAATKRLRKAVL